MLSLLALAALAVHLVDGLQPNVTVSGINKAPSPQALTQNAFNSAFPDCVNGPLKDNAVCDITKDPFTRAKALLSEFTVSDMIRNSVHQVPGVSRLGLPGYNWWSEASHGVSWTGPGVVFAPSGQDFAFATSFPQPITLGAAFDDPLIFAVAQVVSTEGRAFSNAGRAGLTWFAPNINPWRDPRWGRGQETPGEAALHSANYALNFLTGFQGTDSDPYVKNIATCKHYAGYDLDDWEGTIQRNFSAEITTQEFSEYYLPPFQVCARDLTISGIMCSYNSLNGVPTCADDYLLQSLLRDYWKFEEDRWVVSDCDAVESIFENHVYVGSFEEAAAVALDAGTDINCGSIYGIYLQGAFDQNLTTPATLEKSLTRAYASLVRLGYFDPPELQPYRQLTFKDVSTTASEKLAYDVAVEGIVLLKNDGTLPLRKSLKKVALVGPWAQATEQMQGNYFGTAPFLISPQAGLENAGLDVTFVEGTGIQDGSTTGFSDALAAAKAADVIIYAGGIDNGVEAEGLDRTEITWPGAQLQLIQELAAVGKPFIVLQFGAGQVDDTWLLHSKAVNGLIWAGYPGQSGGTAVADILLGHAAPAGRLPLMQYPAEYVEQIGMLDMNLRPNKATGNPGRTFEWYTGKPVFEYGFGLHYTSFSLEWQGSRAAVYSIQALVSRAHSAPHLDLGIFDTFGVTVKNTGHVTSDFVSLLFVKTSNAGPAPYPNKSLLGYARVHAVRPGTAAIARISVNLGTIARVDANGNQVLYPGDYTLSLDVPQRLTRSFKLTGSPVRLTDFPAPPAAFSRKTFASDKHAQVPVVADGMPAQDAFLAGTP